MPRYIYKCETCEDEFLIHHSIGEDLEKKEGCKKECALHRIPQPTLLKNDKKYIMLTYKVYKKFHLDFLFLIFGLVLFFDKEYLILRSQIHL